MDQETEARFWGYVDASDTDGCWPWSAGRDRGGYGQFTCDGKTNRAHRVAWKLINGPIQDGLFVCHRCDNRACCNPAHLWLGTHDENMKDMVLKARTPIQPPRLSRYENTGVPWPSKRTRAGRPAAKKLSRAEVREWLAERRRSGGRTLVKSRDNAK